MKTTCKSQFLCTYSCSGLSLHPIEQTPPVVSPSRSRRGRPRTTKQSPSPPKRKRGRPKKTQEVVEETEESLEEVEEQTQVVVKRAGRKRQSSSKTAKTARSSTSRAKRTKVVTDGESPLEGDCLLHASSQSINAGPCYVRMYVCTV